MTPKEFRKKYKFPESVEGRFEWRFYPRRVWFRPHYRFIRYYPLSRKFSSGIVCQQGVISLNDPITSLIFGKPDDDPSVTDMLRSFLPPHIIARCVAASINPRSIELSIVTDQYEGALVQALMGITKFSLLTAGKLQK